MFATILFAVSFQFMPPMDVTPMGDTTIVIPMTSELRESVLIDPPPCDPTPQARKCTSNEAYQCSMACRFIHEKKVGCSVGTDPLTGKMAMWCECMSPALRT